jgi:hypothetical protein
MEGEQAHQGSSHPQREGLIASHGRAGICPSDHLTGAGGGVSWQAEAVHAYAHMNDVSSSGCLILVTLCAFGRQLSVHIDPNYSSTAIVAFCLQCPLHSKVFHVASPTMLLPCTTRNMPHTISSSISIAFALPLTLCTYWQRLGCRCCAADVLLLPCRLSTGCCSGWWCCRR